MNDLTNSNVACALNFIEFDESAHLVIVGEPDLPNFRDHEEAFLRELGVIPEGHRFNGFIDENPKPIGVAGESSSSSAAPAPPTAPVCFYEHVTSGGCSCTYKKSVLK